MNNIRIFTDSTSDLSKELIKENDISLIPLYVNFKNEIYKDGLDITQQQLYKKIKEYDMLPKTSAPSPQDFINAFKPHVEKKEDIIYIGLSSELSTTFQNANIAKQEFPNANIELIDSRNLSTGIGALVLKACDFREQGMSTKQIVNEIKKLIPKVQTSFFVDTLEYIRKGGRCSALEGFLGNILKIKPIIKVVNGKIIVSQKVRGKTDKVANLMLKQVLKNKNIIDTERIFITHSLGGKTVHYLKQKLQEETNIKKIYITNASSTISSHCGPGTAGILYIEK